MSIMSPKDWEEKVKVEEIEVTRPPCPPKKEILFNDLPKEEQKWQVQAISDEDFDDLSEQGQIAYLKQEMRRIKEGVFFYNNGNIEWLTGVHYFYLNYWRVKGGRPDFRDSDRDFFQVWNEIEQDKDCYGLIYFTDRRSGKTYKGTCILYHAAINSPESHCGIQSKTFRDAQEIFEKLKNGWKNSPYYMKPVDSGDTNPSSALRFEEPGRRSTKGGKKKYKSVLNSKIDYKAANDVAYDGSELTRAYHDEIGKDTEGDVYDRWYIIKPTLEEGINIKGKGLLTSTIEDASNEGLDKCKDLWNESDPNDKGEDGRTTSGLYRLHKLAYQGRDGFIDEYGYSKEEEAIDYIKKEFKKYSGAKLTKEQRKKPIEFSHIFKKDSEQSAFPTWKIEEQLEYNASMAHNRVRVGNFVESNMHDGRVEITFRDDPNGKFKVSELPRKEERNNISVGRHGLLAKNNHLFCAGIDPISKSNPTYGGSKAAAYIYKKFDPINPYNSSFFCVEYIARPPKVEIFFDDMIKVLKFYGCKALVENNAIGLINHFRNNGCEGLLMERPDFTHTNKTRKQKELGIPMNSEATRNSLIEHIESYIYDRVGLIEDPEKLGINTDSDNMYGHCYFDALLENWLKFEPNNWTPYDATVASGLALMASRSRSKERTGKVKTVKKGLFSKYNIRGGKSKKI